MDVVRDYLYIWRERWAKKRREAKNNSERQKEAQNSTARVTALEGPLGRATTQVQLDHANWPREVVIKPSKRSLLLHSGGPHAIERGNPQEGVGQKKMPGLYPVLPHNDLV